MVVRDFHTLNKRESRVLKRIKRRGVAIIRHLRDTDCCPTCEQEVLISLNSAYAELIAERDCGKVQPTDFKAAESEVRAIARRIAAIIGFTRGLPFIGGTEGEH